LGLWWYREHIRRYLRSIGPRKIVCVSEANRQRLMKEHHFPAKKLVTVRNGADLGRFRRDEGARKVWRQRWGATDDALVFGAVGRFHPFKGFGTALEGFRVALRRGPRRPLWLVLAGEGPEEGFLRAQAEAIQPPGRVVFLPFQRRPEEVLSAFDVFVMPSVIEGLPLALSEAMACECPPVAMAVGGIPEAVNHPDLGWLVSAGDGDGFAEAMVDAGSQPAEVLTEMGRRARQQVLEHFNATIQFNRLAEIVESLGHEPRRRGVRRGGSS
jgi:glycosyltransferase involved in cell wall biosynthesis